MEYTSIIQHALEMQFAIGPVAAKIMIQSLPAVMEGIGGLFGMSGAKKRRRKAETAYDQARMGYGNVDISNPYADLENKMEDMRVATQAAEFQAQEQQTSLAMTLDAFRGAGGGTGAAAIAQALATQQRKSNQQIAAQIEQQEIDNEMRARQAAMDIQQLGAAGEESRQTREMDRQSTLLGMAQQEYAGAIEAESAASSAMWGGLGGLATTGLTMGAEGGLFGDKVAGFMAKLAT